MCTFVYRPGALLSTLWLALLFNQCLAGVSNRTIDDVFGDSVTGQLPAFLPENLGVWKDQTCGDCSINPDKRLAHNNTYHSATYNPDLKSVNVTMNFDGTAIYVFLILANNAGPGITTETNCAFKLDGTTVGTFHHIPSTSTDIQFNVLAFSKADIPPGNHQFVIATEGLTTNSYLNFDYALYTHEGNTTSTTPPSGGATSLLSSTPSTPPPQSSNNSKVPAGVIAGSVIGGVACLAAIGACIFFNRHQRRRNIKRINLLGDPDSDTPQTTTTSRRRPPPLVLSHSNTIGTLPATGAASNSSARPVQTTEIPRSSHLPSDNHLSYVHHSSSHIPRNTNTSLVISNPDHQDLTITQQAELQKRVTMMKGKIKNLKADLRSQTGSIAESEDVLEGTTVPPEATPTAANVKALQNQIRMLTEEVSFLQAQQLSPWIRNPNLEPPPDYTAAHRHDEWSSRPVKVRTVELSFSAHSNSE